MRLIQVDYTQYAGTDREWSVRGLTLGPINLLVGQNATGKSRTLHIIHAMGQLLSGKKKHVEAHWTLLFRNEADEIRYELEICEGIVRKEILAKGGDTLLERGAAGTGKIDARDSEEPMQFKIPETTPATIAKRDEYQHPFLEPLHEWASSLRYYPFGGPMGRDKVALPEEPGTNLPDPSDFEFVVALFKSGTERFGGKFEMKVREDMGRIGYALDEVGIEEVTDVTSAIALVARPLCLFAKESDLKAKTPQMVMSQGMFRALSLIVQTVYAELSGVPACVVVDDIGEGLDFERSTKLIDLLMERARNNAFQLIMATNDRFVMNAVPLETWSCLRRTAGGSEVLNYDNSKELFDNFKLTGLGHFDFLTTEYFSETNDDA